MKHFLSVIAIFSTTLIAFGANDVSSSNGSKPIVASRGKITAGDTISRIAAPYTFGSPAILETVLVKKGEMLVQNHEVAILKGREKAAAALDSAKSALERTKSEYALKTLELKNTLEELKGSHAQNDEVLAKDPPRSEREKIKYEQKALLRQIGHAEEILKAAKANETAAIACAQTAIKEAELALEDFTIKTPIAGKVIEIHAKPGETIGNEGVCEVADTNQMYVEAEVYISDIKRVAIGDYVECSPEALPNELLKGKVIEISRYVKTNRLFSQDPSEYTDMKVINVKISLDDSDKVDNLIGSLVRVRIFVEK